MEPCKTCDGKGWYEGHELAGYAHDEDGFCLGYCLSELQCPDCYEG